MGTDAVMLKALEMAKAQLSNYKMASTREEIITAARNADPGFGSHTLGGSIVGFEAVERFYAIARASRDAEVAELKAKLSLFEYAAAEYDIKFDHLSKQVKMLRDAIEYSGAAKSCQGLADALAATEPKP